MFGGDGAQRDEQVGLAGAGVAEQHEWFAVGLSPRKASLTFYGLTYYGSNDDLLARLGPHTTGKGCLYVKRLEDVDEAVLRELVARAWETNHSE